MMNQNIQPQNIQLPHELTPRDDTKKIVSEVLKRVDQLIRKGDLERAQGEIHKAKELDPKNVYALALEERIFALRNELDRMEEAKRTIQPVQPPIVLNPIHSISDVVSTPPEPKPIPATAVSRPAPPKLEPSPIPPNVSESEAKKDRDPLQDRVIDRSIELESYRKALTEMWTDGALNDEERHQLQELQLLLEITDEEHKGIEKNVKRECYKNTIIRKLSNNPLALSNAKSLFDLRNAFQITEDEHQQIQIQLMSVITQKQRSKILVVDDDTKLLELLAASLEDNGFDVTALPTSDEAYALLRKFVPDLILCDINLETSTMGGFTFYEKVQELKNLQTVPFVFLSGLTDEVLVRTGKELGVDDYLMKPISEQTLVSTLRGKLKRFKQLRKLTESPPRPLAAA